MAVTIRQIAAVVGVSRGTVDRVLHSRPGVKPEIAEQVRRVADDLGFEPNRAGKILAARKQPLKIGCLLPAVGNLFFQDVVAGFRRAEMELDDFGVSVLLREIEGYDAEEHLCAIEDLVRQGCSALCLSTLDVPKIREAVDRLEELGIPVVAVNTDLTGTKRLCYVGCDYFVGGRTAAGLLALMGPKRLNLLTVTGSLWMKGHNERIKGFYRTLQEKQVQYKLADMFESQDNDERAYQLTLEALTAHPEINCIYIVAAGVQGVCRAVTDAGRKGIYVLSYDEIAATRELMRNGVISFTIGQDPVEQGYRAIQILFNYFMSDKRRKPSDYITGTVIRIKENLMQT